MKPEPARPLVSVVMSVYNGRAHLAKAIESIFGQTLGDFEFVIIDDGSTDGATEDLRRYAERDERIRLILQENRGLTKSLNRGLGMARGEFIARMDSDDISYPQRLARQVAAFGEQSDLVLLGAEVELISEKGIRLGPRGHPLAHAGIRRQLLMGNGGALTHPVVMFRRRAMAQVGEYDEAFATAQDLDLFLRLSEVGTVANLPETLLEWRQHAQSINRMRSDTWASVKSRAMIKTLNRIGIHQFAAEFFAEADTFHFPTSNMQLAELAFGKGRPKEARNLLLEEARQGQRWSAICLLAKFWATLCYRKLRGLMRDRQCKRVSCRR